MNRRELLIVAGGAVVTAAASVSLAEGAAASTDPASLERWKAQAQALIPKLIETEQMPVYLVRAVAAADSPLRFRMEREASADELSRRVLRRGASVIGDIHINSYCHAWSCTPSYFLRSGKLPGRSS